MIFGELDPRQWVEAYNTFREGNPVLAGATTAIGYVALVGLVLWAVVIPFVNKVAVPLINAIKNRKDGPE